MADSSVAFVGARIRELRMAAGLSMDQLAARIAEQTGTEVHFTTISKIERSVRTISVDWVVKIANALGVSPADVLQDSGRKPIRMVPLVGKIAAGNWREAILDPVEMIPVSEAPPNAFALEPEGSSMNRLIERDAVVVIDPDDFELRDGRIYAVMNADGETTLKLFRADPPRLEPSSTDPEHQPIQLGREPFTVIGRVTSKQVRM